MPQRVSWVDRLLLAASIVLVSAAIVLLVERRQSTSSGKSPWAIQEAAGMALRELMAGDSATTRIGLVGRPHVIYVFSTTCRYCELQKRHIADLLQSVDTQSVLTVSTEPEALTRAYWSEEGVSLPPPARVPDETVARLGLNGTPALIFVSARGSVTSAYLGMVMSWSKAKMAGELAKAAKG